MVPIFSLFLIIMLSIVITRIATIALIHTGLSRETARFQARSALTGSGFTTSESEQVVNHPVRRKNHPLSHAPGPRGHRHRDVVPNPHVY